MPLQTLDSFSFNHKDQQDKLYESKTSTQVKEAFDSRGEELRESLNNNLSIINNEFAKTSELQWIILGQIPDNSITEAKLSIDLKKKYDDKLFLDIRRCRYNG